MADPVTPQQSEEAEDTKRFSVLNADLGEIFKGAIARSRSAADSVRNAAAAIATVYAAILGLAFSSDRPLPARGVIAAFFLGAAIVCSSVYLAYIRPWMAAKPIVWPVEAEGKNLVELRAIEQERTNLVRYMTRLVTFPRSYWLRAAVIALGFGVAFLPAAFIVTSHSNADVVLTPEWPQAEQTSNAPSVELFKAQVAEISERRKASLADAEAAAARTGDGAWLVLAIVAAAVVYLGAVPRWLAKRLKLGSWEPEGGNPGYEVVPSS